MFGAQRFIVFLSSGAVLGLVVQHAFLRLLRLLVDQFKTLSAHLNLIAVPSGVC